MAVQCPHNSKLRKEGLCNACSDLKPYTVFKYCDVKSCPKDHTCVHGGYFWGPGAPESLQGQQIKQNREKPKKLYTAYSVREWLKPKWDTYFAKLSIGQASNWKCDQRTAELFCLSQWLMDELLASSCPLEDRLDVQDFFNRKARAENDLYEVAARAMNSMLEGKIDRFRRKPRVRE